MVKTIKRFFCWGSFTADGENLWVGAYKGRFTMRIALVHFVVRPLVRVQQM